MSDAVEIRVLIVDDEAIARRRIRRMLRDDPGVHVVGECSDGLSAIAEIQDSAPDLIFLDVQMPSLNAFQVLEALKPDQIPAVIFVTAYDQYALQAFAVHALDYLLKPFDKKRFQAALQRARTQISQKKDTHLDHGISSLLQELKNKPKHVERLVIKSSGRLFFIKTDEIDWIEAEGKYVNIHVGNESHLVREAMNALESQLDPGKFLRIHRSTIVNIDRIRQLEPWFHGEYRVLLYNGTRLMLSRSHRQRFHELVGKPI